MTRLTALLIAVSLGLLAATGLTLDAYGVCTAAAVLSAIAAPTAIYTHARATGEAMGG